MRSPGRPKVWCSAACRLAALRRESGSFVRGDVLRSCAQCGEFELGTRGSHRFCSRECGARHRYSLKPKCPEWAQGRRREREYPCKYCGVVILTRAPVVICEACRGEQRRSANRRKRVKRRGAYVGVKYTLAEIGARDGWRCHLCHKKVDASLPGTAPRGPTVDHLVPLAAGGLDELTNVALAHRSCNVKRRDKGNAQLRLVG